MFQLQNGYSFRKDWIREGTSSGGKDRKDRFHESRHRCCSVGLLRIAGRFRMILECIFPRLSSHTYSQRNKLNWIFRCISFHLISALLDTVNPSPVFQYSTFKIFPASAPKFSHSELIIIISVNFLTNHTLKGNIWLWIANEMNSYVKNKEE